MKPSRVQFTADVLKRGHAQLKAGKVGEAMASIQEARREIAASGEARGVVGQLVAEALDFLRSGDSDNAAEQVAGAIWALENDFS